ncbi:appetite-regulating hormone [Heteronotia binoei]|uniref:appetite-regulating hormone n=1 Tax=Heteronotia binoei TaxID=13085 RepID=UPI002931D537|nr:appetite-regulating hormone [Heteronotia binoei]
MFFRATVLATILVFLLWPESTTAGSSFLSPEQPKTQQRKPPPKPAKLHGRDARAVLDVHRTEGDTNEIQIKFNVPFEIGMKVSEEQYDKYGQILDQFLEDVLTEDSKENQEKK